MSTREQLEFQRCFESLERMEWVSALPCVVPGCRATPCENAHIGMGPNRALGRSALIVPTCPTHRALLQGQLGTEKFAALYQVDLAAEAIDVELRWRQHCAKLAGEVPLF
jgi:hypothetical protein